MAYILDTYHADYHGDTIKIGIEHYDEIAQKLKITYNVLRYLTYRPELIRIALPYLRDNIKEILVLERSQRHPLLHELMHQSNLLYITENVVDPAYDIARENLEYFVSELKTFAPEFFTMTDTYLLLPINRLEYIDLDHPATKRLVDLL